MEDFSSRMNNIINEATLKATKLVSTYGKPRYIAAMIEIVISAVAIIGIQIVSMGFDFSKLISLQFWIKTSALTLCMFLLYRAIIHVMFDKTANRKHAKEIKEEYDSLNKDKDLDLNDYLEEFNLNTKIGVYVSKINKRIYKLERKKIKTIKVKKKTKLGNKIAILKQEISPERVKEVIAIANVKYYIVYYDDFKDVERAGGNGKISTRGYKDFNRVFNIASFNKMWIYVLCTVILSLSIWTFGDTSTITIISNVASALVMIITRIVSALVESERIYDSTITASYVCKIDILKGYYKWRNERVESKIKQYDKPIEIGNGKIEVAS